MKLSLRQKVLLPTLAVVATGIAVVSVVNYVRSRNAMVSNLTDQMGQICATTVTHMEDWYRQQMINVEGWAGQKLYWTAVQDSFVGQAARVSANAELGNLLKRYAHFDRIHVLNTNGVVIASSDTNQINKLNLGDRDYFKAALQGKSSVSEAMLSKVSGKPVVALAAPLKEGEKIVGALVGIVDVEQYSRAFIDPIKVQGGGYVFVADQRGLTLAHPVKTNILTVNVTQFEWGQKLLEQKNGQLTYTYAGEEKICIFQTSKELGWTFCATLKMTELMAPVRQAGYLTALVGLITLAATVVIILLVVRSVANPLDRVIHALSDSADQVASASSQITTSSQALAEGASEQAASLEETSASLEEMASMIQRNAENSQRANELSNQTRSAAEAGSADMAVMQQAMQDLKASSDDIAKIIKTIDEIAFQTNILALNAAVEAARAGQAGAGFAVVADEVRNLAQRSAQAARETAEKIEAAITKTDQGVRVSEKVAQSLKEIVEKARKVDEMGSAVATASKEQNQGIKQVNSAVSQMDKVTQSNAASAEESASAAEELSAQAEAMKEAVGELVTLVGGSTQLAVRSAKLPAPETASPKPAVPVSHSTSGNGRAVKPPALSPTAVRRNELPMPAEKSF